MTTWLLLLALHLLYWSVGAIWIVGLLPATRLFSLRSPGWFTAYWLGLFFHSTLAFILNQYFEVSVSLLGLVLQALHVLVISAFVFRKIFSNARTPLQIEPQPWRWDEVGLAALVATVWALRHAPTGPLTDFDMPMYHLPFAQTIAEGQFPSEMGRSLLGQFEAAYPQLIYFFYALNLFVESPDLTWLGPRLWIAVVNGCTCITAYYFARQRLKLDAVWALLTSLTTALFLNTIPNNQSYTTLFLTLAVYYSWEAFAPRIGDKSIKPGGDAPVANESFVLAALFWSGCYWCSYVGLPLTGIYFLGLLAGEAWSRVRLREPSIDLAKWLGACLTIAFCLFPHMLRNWLALGNPIYPGLLGILGGSEITEWFLAHRPAGGSPMEKDWTYLPEALWRAAPMAQIILCGAASVMHRSTLRQSSRVLLFVVFLGFLVLWFEKLHFDSSANWRYLFPLSPLATAAVMALLAHLWRDPRLPQLLGSGCVIGMCCLLALPHQLSANPWFLERPTWMAGLHLLLIGLLIVGLPLLITRLRKVWTESTLPPDSSRHVLLVFLVVVFVISAGWSRSLAAADLSWAIIALLVVGAAALIARVAEAAPRYREGTAAALVGLAAIGVYYTNTNWKQADKYALPIKEDVTWLNENLSSKDLILTFESRLFELKQNWIPIDDYRMEQVYLAESEFEAVQRLRQVGVTHFYFSTEAGNVPWASFRDEVAFLSPQGSEYAELVHQSDTGYVVKVRY